MEKVMAKGMGGRGEEQGTKEQAPEEGGDEPMEREGILQSSNCPTLYSTNPLQKR